MAKRSEKKATSGLANNPSSRLEELLSNPVFSAENLRQYLDKRGVQTNEQMEEVLRQLLSGEGAGAAEVSPSNSLGQRASQALAEAHEHLDRRNHEGTLVAALRAVVLDPENPQNLLFAVPLISSSLEERTEIVAALVAREDKRLARQLSTNKGRCWEDPATRAYLRARHRLMLLRIQAEDLSAALHDAMAILDLDVEDHLEVREFLAVGALELGLLDVARFVFSRYSDDSLPGLAWAGVLEAHVRNDTKARAAALLRARALAPRVEKYLSREKRIRSYNPSRPSAPGSEQEARAIAFTQLGAWNRHPDAAEWLRLQV